MTWLLDGRTRFKPKQSGSSLYTFLLLRTVDRERKQEGDRSKRRRKMGVCFPPMFPNVCLVSKAGSMSGLLHPTGHECRNGPLNSRGSTSMLAHIYCPFPAAWEGLRDSTSSSNKHVEIDGSHTSQLRLAARFGEITFPGTNWEPVWGIKGTAH